MLRGPQGPRKELTDTVVLSIIARLRACTSIPLLRVLPFSPASLVIDARALQPSAQLLNSMLGKRYAKTLGVCGCSLLESSETFVLKLLRSRFKVVKLESCILRGLETGGSEKLSQKRKLSLA